jgi:hypothetical protein
VYYVRRGKDGSESVWWRWYTPPNVDRSEMVDIPSRKDKRASKLLTVSSLPGTTVAVNAVQIQLAGNPDGKSFIYDTPGLLPHWHQSSPLTLHHLRRALIRTYRNPACFIVLPKMTLLLGGVAAIDVVKGAPQGLLLMVYTSPKVKSTIVDTERSDEFWVQNLGSAIEPPGSIEDIGDLRLTEQKSYLFECYRRHFKVPKADIYVCGMGWVSFCCSTPCDVVLKVRTLPGIVHGVREPLRRKDLLIFKGWPQLRRRFSGRPEPESVDKVIRLTCGEVTPEAPALKLLERTKHPKDSSTAAEPFNDLMKQLLSRPKV